MSIKKGSSNFKKTKFIKLLIQLHILFLDWCHQQQHILISIGQRQNCEKISIYVMLMICILGKRIPGGYLFFLTLT